MTARNGAWLRLLAAWMFRATTSFPVPLSPVRRTMASLRAIRGRILFISRMAGWSPIMGAAPGKRRSERARCDSLSLRFSIARSMMIRRRARSTGFSK